MRSWVSYQAHEPQKMSYRAAVNWFVLLGRHHQGCSASPTCFNTVSCLFPFLSYHIPFPGLLSLLLQCCRGQLFLFPVWLCTAHSPQCECDLCYRDIKAQHPLGKGEIKGGENVPEARQAEVVFSPLWNNNLPEGVLSTRSGSSRGSVHSVI